MIPELKLMRINQFRKFKNEDKRSGDFLNEIGSTSNIQDVKITYDFLEKTTGSK